MRETNPNTFLVCVAHINSVQSMVVVYEEYKGRMGAKACC